jgi:multisubunit Na+/H+ antiporter MnhB subunit
MDELQEMREQMAVLKEKLNKQEIINEKNLRKLMFRKALRFKIFMWIGILLIATPTVALWIMNFAWFEGTHTDFELIWETITTSIMLTMLIIGTSIIKLRDIRSGNLQTVKEQIRKMSTPLVEKKYRIVWNVFAIMVIVLFLSYRYDNGRFEILAFDMVWLVVCVVPALLNIFLPGWQRRFGEWIAKRMGIKKRPTEWEEYINQIEEMSELDEGNDKEEKEL